MNGGDSGTLMARSLDRGRQGGRYDVVVRTVLIVAAFLAVVVSGCAPPKEHDGLIHVVATTTQLGDFARQVGGDRVNVKTLLDAATDPHEYEPRPSDARAIAEADVVLESGGEVDAWLDDVVDAAGGEADVVDVGEAIHAGGDDPHWWQDPLMTLRATRVIEAALRRADPTGADAYRRGAAAFGAEVSRLSEAIGRCMRSIPVDRRRLVTNHDSFGWFARRYDIEVLGSVIPGRATSARPSARDVRELVDAIRREHVTTIFPESALDQRVEQAVARDAGAKVGETLYADTLGKADTYVEALTHDAAAMARGFGGRCDL
jgi:zinc/manganese transport system substrate-binding protein